MSTRKAREEDNGSMVSISHQVNKGRPEHQKRYPFKEKYPQDHNSRITAKITTYIANLDYYESVVWESQAQEIQGFIILGGERDNELYKAQPDAYAWSPNLDKGWQDADAIRMGEMKEVSEGVEQDIAEAGPYMKLFSVVFLTDDVGIGLLEYAIRQAKEKQVRMYAFADTMELPHLEKAGFTLKVQKDLSYGESVYGMVYYPEGFL